MIASLIPRAASRVGRLALAVGLGFLAARAAAATQSFQLSADWNLICFQVIPDNPEPAAVFATLPGFRSVWAFESASGLWQRHVRPEGTPPEQEDATTANGLLSLEPVRPGVGYWVRVDAATAWSVEGTVPRGLNFPTLHLDSGWQLIGIPMGAAQVTNAEPVSLLGVLTAAGFDYDALLTWSNSYRKLFRPQGGDDHPLAGFPPDPPFPTFDLQRDAGRGYWVRVIRPGALRPNLLTTVRPDVDVEPLGNFPAREDQNVSGATNSAAMKSIADQDTIRFFPGEDGQILGIANVSTDTNAAGGILLWEVEWAPTTDLATPEPWIRLFSAPGQRELRDIDGQLLSAHTNLTGVTTIENDLVYLRLDRRHLGRGVHEGTLKVRSSVGDRSFRVVAEVPGLEGDFAGQAVIRTVQGRRNPVPDVDLAVTIYEDARTPGLLRGVIDSAQTVLWPVDVPLVGYRVSDRGNRFVLGGSYVLPPGDQNGEPFGVWDENDSAAGRDVDWLDDGRLDAVNPFPFPIQRTVLLEGELARGNPTDGYVLAGDYRETVYGFGSEPIELLGSFELTRRSPRAFATRLPGGTDTGVEAVVSTNATPALVVPAGQARTNVVNVATELELKALQASLKLSGPSGGLGHSNLVVLLRSPGPNGAELTLYDGSTPATALRARALERVHFPGDRPPGGDLDLFLRTIPRTRSDPALGRSWHLVLRNLGSESVTLVSWELRLEGQPVTAVHGVVEDHGQPLAGVTVQVSGLPISLASPPTGADGRFTLERVPLLPLNFTAERPGYRAADPARPGLDLRFTTAFGDDQGAAFSPVEEALRTRFRPLAGAPSVLAGVPGFEAGGAARPFALEMAAEPVDEPAILAGPLEAAVGSTVQFTALGVAGGVRWEFGDGGIATDPLTSHAFAVPGLYRVQLFTPQDAVTAAAEVEVVMLAAPGRAPARPVELAGEPTGLELATASAPYAGYMFQVASAGGGVVETVAPKSAFAVDETNALGAAWVARLPLQHTYAASMDLDLAPHLSPERTTRPFNDDGFVALAEPGFDPEANENPRGFKREDFNYALPEGLWVGTLTSAGAPEYSRDPAVGLIVWGNAFANPRHNYAAEPARALDNATFTVSLDEGLFHPHRGLSTFEDLGEHATVHHFRLTCSLGAGLLTVPLPATAVREAAPGRGDPPALGLAPLTAAGAANARSLYYHLEVGSLARP